MENPVVNSEEIIGLGLKPVDAAEPQEISAADLLAGDQQQEPDETVIEDTTKGVTQQEVDAPKQADIQAAFGKEMQRIRQAERAKYEQQLADDPARRIGSLLLQEMMQRHKCDAATAYKIAEENYWQSKGEELNLHPAIARQLLGQQAAPKKAEPDPQTEAERIRQEVAELKASNAFPEGFDFDEAVKDLEFVGLLSEMPVKAAARVYLAEQKAKKAPQDVAEKLQAREAIPKPMKPQQTNPPGEIDYSSLSDDEFFALESKIQNARLSGRRVRL